MHHFKGRYFVKVGFLIFQPELGPVQPSWCEEAFVSVVVGPIEGQVSDIMYFLCGHDM